MVLAPVDAFQAFLFISSHILGASEGLFEEIRDVGGVENKNEKVRLNMFCQHEKVPYAELTRFR